MDILVTYLLVNQRGKTQRDQRRVIGATLSIGRGTQCQIQLPDPRVALTHARITVATPGVAAIAAESGVIEINNRAVTGRQQLTVGDRIEIGPYLFEVEAPPGDCALALAVSLTTPLTTLEGSEPDSAAPRAGISCRRLSYLGFFGILLLCLLMPIAADFIAPAPTPPAVPTLLQASSAVFSQRWNPGPLRRGHQVIGNECRACHVLPFVQVRDTACLACHKTLKAHGTAIPPSEAAAKTAPEATLAHATPPRCASCHPDHKGTQASTHAQAQCVECHRDIKRHAPNTQVQNATDFRDDHPDFRLSLAEAPPSKKIRRVRQNTSDPQALAEHSNLKFNHRVHLNPAGVRDPRGSAATTDTPGSKVSRTVLNCTSCHLAEKDGQRMAPIVMKQHCQGCHSLAFEPTVSQRQVPHAAVKDVTLMLQEFYARLVLGDIPAGVTPPQDLPRFRPGAVLGADERRHAMRLADEKTKRVLHELSAKRGVCSTCHLIAPQPGSDAWEILPLRIATAWLPQARFPHHQHSATGCTTCHPVLTSTKATEIAIPSLALCRKCHTGARAMAGKVATDCAGCHDYHGSAGWQKTP